MNAQKELVDTEFGGITQKIASFQATTPSGNTFTFLDTPGHEAFQNMRAHCAKTTDIAFLLVRQLFKLEIYLSYLLFSYPIFFHISSLDDGIQQQTKEAYEIIQSNELPFVVVITKLDKGDQKDAELLMKEIQTQLGIVVDRNKFLMTFLFTNIIQSIKRKRRFCSVCCYFCTQTNWFG